MQAIFADPLYIGSHHIVSSSQNLEIIPKVNSPDVCALLRIRTHAWGENVNGMVLRLFQTQVIGVGQKVRDSG